MGQRRIPAYFATHKKGGAFVLLGASMGQNSVNMGQTAFQIPEHFRHEISLKCIISG